MQPYRPEGTYALPPSPELLRRSMRSGNILQAMCTKCDEHHNLHVDLGSIRGIIPRSETALSVSGGPPRDYAVLSRVGKAVCFQVMDFDSDGNAILSRRRAQLDAKNYFLCALRPGDVIPAMVQNPTEIGAFCDIGCGFTALMRIDRCCISRLETTAQWFSVGQSIYAAIQRIDDEFGRIDLTGKELLGTWEENANNFCVGETVTGVVRSVMPYGVFVELTPNLSGLSEPDSRVGPGDAVSVYIRSIQHQRHKIKLSILEVLPNCDLPKRMDYRITSGHIDHWEYYPGSRNTTYF